jgi:hypothetical protein
MMSDREVSFDIARVTSFVGVHTRTREGSAVSVTAIRILSRVLGRNPVLWRPPKFPLWPGHHAGSGMMTVIPSKRLCRA